MFVDVNTMERIHSIQLDMWKELASVMGKLELNYYFVHGSLLGAVTRGDFIIEDDDIDIAMFREDYNRLMQEGNKYLSSRYFLQSSINDDYPLAFAKMRDCETAFIQPVLNKCKCNKGIYIDIFPIDYMAENRCCQRIEALHELLLELRINTRLNSQGTSIKNKLATALSYIIYPKYSTAIASREKMYTKRRVSEIVQVTNGKASERGIPRKWFQQGLKKEFGGGVVNCPQSFEDYLIQIYGKEYMNFNPARDRIENQEVELSCQVLDFEKSYTFYQ